MNKFREIMIPGDILEDEGLSDGARIIYGKIARLSYKEGYCWANNEFLSGVKSRRTTSRFIAELQAAGYVKILTGRSKNRKIVLCEIKSKASIIDNPDYDEKNNIDKNDHDNNMIDKNGDDKTPIIDKIDTDHRQICPQIIDKFGDITTNRTTKRTSNKKKIHGSNEPPDKNNKTKQHPSSLPKKDKPFELLSREPKNDIERVNKKWLENYIAIYGNQPLEPDWKITSPLIKKIISQVGVKKLLDALDTAKNDKFCLEAGYILKTIVAVNTITRLMNKPPPQNSGYGKPFNEVVI